MNRKKIALVGSGQIGAALAVLSTVKELGNVVMFDVVEGMPQGKALDLCHLAPIEGADIRITGSNDFSSMIDSDVVIVTAGIARKPGMTRDDLLAVNAKIIRQVAEAIRTYCPKAFVICVTNPLDAMVHLLKEESGLPPCMVCGMAGVLDSSRFRYLIAEKMGVSVEDVSALVMGGHGDSMVPLLRYCSVGGIPLQELINMGSISQTDVDSIVDRTRNGGGEVVKLLKTGSAFHSPASAALLMAESYLKDKKRLIGCSAYLNGEYNVHNLYVGVPCIIGAGGVEKVLELNLLPHEEKMFIASVQAVRELVNSTPK